MTRVYLKKSDLPKVGQGNLKYELGQVYDVWWEIVKIETEENRYKRFTLKNQMNGQEVTVSSNAMRVIAEGKKSISKIIYRKIYRQDLKEGVPHLIPNKRYAPKKYKK